jgi:hypothetical protein
MEFKQLYFLFYRIFPFVIISFFTIYSIAVGEVTGILVASGALITSIITIMISGLEVIKTNIINHRNPQGAGILDIGYATAYCNILTFNNTIISYLPLSTHTISFIIGYLFMAAVPNFYIVIPLLIFLMIDVAYNYLKCTGVLVIIPLVIGLTLGVGWGALSKPIFEAEGKETCKAATKSASFNCRRRGLKV